MHNHTLVEEGQSQSSIIATVRSLTEGEPDAIANMANTAAVLWYALPDINWVGFYVVRGSELVLGPFQGKPACIRIGYNRGVCGKAWAQMNTIVVPDVHAFEDHIVCDARSQSEVVVPIMVDSRVVAVLDVDSPLTHRFSPADAEMLGAIAQILGDVCHWP